ncbi:MAG TPA: M20/M25/M40 family metallo-hydrolase [Flavobacteriaceae bacterium]|nr:M20/M25/M40 family metallo-hydrolase [Flavobacteriaceae bacterium]
MKKSLNLIFTFLFLLSFNIYAQDDDPVIQNIIKEANENSDLERLAHELLDVVGPRLVGTPQMANAGDWAVNQFKEWKIEAKNEQYGEWRGWERGITHVDMVYPRIQTLDGMQLAWSYSTPPEGITAEVIILSEVKDSLDFQKWLPNVKGKFVMIYQKEITGRPDENWEEYATEESFTKMKSERDSLTKAWRENMARTGYASRYNIGLSKKGIALLEDAGAVGIISSYWSKGFGVNRIFSANTKKVPRIDLELEDYTMLYRMVEYGDKPQIKVVAESKELGVVPAFNIIGEIKGVEKPNEYVMLSAHFDSWDGATGATDNGTGTLVMMETMRILKKMYSNPKRTILIGLWGSEEQGLNGSRAYVEDHPEIVANIQAVFNQDNGTGRVTEISGSGFVDAYEYVSDWLYPVPQDIKKHIKTEFPGTPSSGGSDHAAFIAAGAPAFSLSSLSWDYGTYTWHTNRDTYDKIVFDDVRNNVILTAILTYMACEDPDRTSREKRVMPKSSRTGKQTTWPTPRSPKRKGGLD